jgi:receptor protein-tyrosine kinase
LVYSGFRDAMAEEAPLNLMQRAAEKLRALGAQTPGETAMPLSSPSRAEAGTAGAAVERPAPTAPLRRKESQQAAIDINRLILAGMVSPRGDKTLISEEFRILKRPLLLKAFSEEGRAEDAHVIMVTSSLPGEGKTFTAVNLAMSIASEADLNVLLVDGDVMNPSVLPRLGIEGKLGLTDLLTDPQLDLSDVLMRCENVPNLTLLPAGTATLRATELLASHRMDALMTDLARRYTDRVIVIDTPPVLATSEPSVMALHDGQSLLVIEAEKTSQTAIEASLRQLTRCPNINLMLNKATSTPSSEQFGGYGTYGYGSYATRRN